MLQRRMRAEGGADLGQAAHGAAGEPQPLGGVVGEAREAETLPDAQDVEAMGEVGEDGAEGPGLAAQGGQGQVELAQDAGFAREASGGEWRSRPHPGMEPRVQRRNLGTRHANLQWERVSI